MRKKPSDILNCLLIYPQFSQFSFWNTRTSAALVGAKAPAPPLGLITVAAILPQHWRFRLVDLNATSMTDSDWDWADLVCVGGMLPQQSGILSVISECKKRGVFAVVGGPDPTSQPDLYTEASARVLNEGEITIPIWLESWAAGQPEGLFTSSVKPDVTKSPMPRFDLLKIRDYYAMGVQYSRGCPFNCEFCDIIELYGRVPRLKTTEQMLGELEALYQLGYRGHVEIVDDNFIGNKRQIKRELLPALIEWNKKRKSPFFFGIEASMNLGDDLPLIDLMRDANFRFVFTGIETPDPELLMMTQKTQNAIKPIKSRVENIVRQGMIVTAGFIVGFDNEKKNMGRSITNCIDDTAICMAMVGMLVALPNTQLTKRLLREKRLLDFALNPIDSDAPRARVDDLAVKAIDQTLAGLNFITTRDRFEIMEEFVEVVDTIYAPEAYMARVMRTVKTMKYRFPRLQHGFEIKRSLRGLLMLSWGMTKNRELRVLFWINFFRALGLGLYRFEIAMTLMGVYLHFYSHTRHLKKLMPEHINVQKDLVSRKINVQQAI